MSDSAPSPSSHFLVEGMTCSHYEATISSAIGELAGVSAVSADAATGQVVVTSTDVIDETALRAAVEGAGYTVVGR